MANAMLTESHDRDIGSAGQARNDRQQEESKRNPTQITWIVSVEYSGQSVPPIAFLSNCV